MGWGEGWGERAAKVGQRWGRGSLLAPKIVKWPEGRRSGGMWFAEKGSGLASQENNPVPSRPSRSS